MKNMMRSAGAHWNANGNLRVEETLAADTVWNGEGSDLLGMKASSPPLEIKVARKGTSISDPVGYLSHAINQQERNFIRETFQLLTANPIPIICPCRPTMKPRESFGAISELYTVTVMTMTPMARPAVSRPTINMPTWTEPA